MCSMVCLERGGYLVGAWIGSDWSGHFQSPKVFSEAAPELPLKDVSLNFRFRISKL